MKEKNKILFKKYSIDTKEYEDFFYKTSSLYLFLDLKKKKIKKKNYIILQPKIDNGYVYISNKVSESIIETLFNYSSTSNLEGDIIMENQYNDYFIFSGIENIYDFNILIHQNHCKKRGNYFHDIKKKLLLKNYKEWFLKSGGVTRKGRKNTFHYYFFLDKKDHNVKKDILFNWTWPDDGDQTPFETNYRGGCSKQWKIYKKMLENVDDIWNEMVEKGFNIMKIDFFDESEFYSMDDYSEICNDE